jgi:hypothetical protein
MRLRQQIVAIFVALAMLGASLSTGLGHDNHDDDLVETSSITVLPGDPLSAFLTQASMGLGTEITSGGLTGSMVVRIHDERGYATGWSVSLTGSDFTGPSGHLGADLLTLTPATTTVVLGNPDLAGLTAFDVAQMSTRPAVLWSAADSFGDGHYELVIDSTLGLPNSSGSGYLYTIIVNIDGSAP